MGSAAAHQPAYSPEWYPDQAATGDVDEKFLQPLKPVR